MLSKIHTLNFANHCPKQKLILKTVVVYINLNISSMIFNLLVTSFILCFASTVCIVTPTSKQVLSIIYNLGVLMFGWGGAYIYMIWYIS